MDNPNLSEIYMSVELKIFPITFLFLDIDSRYGSTYLPHFFSTKNQRYQTILTDMTIVPKLTSTKTFSKMCTFSFVVSFF